MHADFIKFEAGIDGFVGGLKEALRQHAYKLKKVSTPQSLASYQIQNTKFKAMLRVVLIGKVDGDLVARVSWLGTKGKEKTCCYVNDLFEAVTLKTNGRWVKSKRSPCDMCLRELASLADECES